MFNTRAKGFTLIELLVVIGIIGLLASIVLSSLDSARKKGRDSRRISDIKQIQLALELYYDANGAFPPNTGSANTFDSTLLTGAGYISVMPTDPTTYAAYKYTAYALSGTASVCSSYHLGAGLEVSNPALSQDVDISANNGGKPPSGYTICTSGTPPSNDFDGWATGAACTGTIGTNYPGTELCYDVKP
jgi:prepilin-type N-terminal cleavage/methylation domain-containing protein